MTRAPLAAALFLLLGVVLAACDEGDPAAIRPTAALAPSLSDASLDGSRPPGPDATSASTAAAPGGSTTADRAVSSPVAQPADPDARPVTGLFSDPRPREPDARASLGEPPDSPFRGWDGVSTVVYDTRTLEEFNLGPGERGRFSPDSARMVWSTIPERQFGPTEVRLLDLETMQWQPFGPGRAPRFVDGDHVVFFESGGNRRLIVDLRTGDQREALPGEAPDFPDPVTPEGYVIVRTAIGPEPYPFLRNRFELQDQDGGPVLLPFEAYMVKPAGPGELVVATPPTTPRDGTTNIFIVEIASGQATFVATSRFSVWNWPLAADAARVVWTEDFCGLPPGRTRIYDRRSEMLTEVDRSDWVELTPDGAIAASRFGFGARWLVDPATLTYIVTIPELAPGVPGSAGDVSWSPDYRYASHGIVGGHGGLCG
jgi:hypothetical protein